MSLGYCCWDLSFRCCCCRCYCLNCWRFLLRCLLLWCCGLFHTSLVVLLLLLLCNCFSCCCSCGCCCCFVIVVVVCLLPFLVVPIVLRCWLMFHSPVQRCHIYFGNWPLIASGFVSFRGGGVGFLVLWCSFLVQILCSSIS